MTDHDRLAKMRIAPGERPRVKAACLCMLAGLSLDAARERLVSHFVDSTLRIDETETELAESVAEADRGEFISAAELLRGLSV